VICSSGVRSMTGYGRGVVEAASARATVDVRAVNHRFLDLKLRGTPLSPALEEGVAARVRAALDRGAVTVAVHVARAGSGTLRIDTDAAVRAHGELAALAARLGTAPPDLALVLAQPGVVAEVADRPDGDDDPPVLAAVDAALVQLDAMRRAEGEALAAELSARVAQLAGLRATLATVAGAVPPQLAKRMHERVRRLLDDTELDPGRLAQEIALLADRADVTEELVRLGSHLDQARALIASASGGPVGRRLDFLVQEIGRELNTIGSKSATTEISTTIVEAKAVLEKVREQVQNVE
jgi:uncharacterized protein (TIGR00255 family)